MNAGLFIAVYCVAVVASSIFGGWLPTAVRITHTRLQMMMSLVGGLMLGIGLFHLLPHAAGSGISLDTAVLWMMFGLLTTFFLIRVFHAHEHGAAEDSAASDPHCDHDHDHTHAHAMPAAAHSGRATHRWLGIALGLSLHTLLDGVALAAGTLSDAAETNPPTLLGFAAFVGIVLHKPLDSLSITSLMVAHGWSRRARQAVNLGYALMCPAGAVLFMLGVGASANQAQWLGCGLAFSAGIFLCLALSDLLPELHFHAHDRLKLTGALLLGVSLAYAIRFLEPEHLHDHAAPHGEHVRGHGHGHEH